MTTTPPEYLKSSFDPNKALVSQLRGILLAHDIPYSSAAKKSELVKLYESKIRPQAASLLRELSQVKASTHGILDGESQDGSLVELETGSESAAEQEAEQQRAKGKSKHKIKTRKSVKRADKAVQRAQDSDDDDIEIEPALPTTSKSTKVAQRTAEKQSQVTPSKRKSNAQTSEQAESSSTRKDPQSALRYESAGESGFSDYNPFQSGAEETPERQNKRRKSSMGPRRSTLGLSAGTPAVGRKSMPELPTTRRFDEDDIAVDSEDVEMAQEEAQPLPPAVPASTSRIVNSSSNPGTPGVKYMVPVTGVSRPASPRVTPASPLIASDNKPTMSSRMADEHHTRPVRSTDSASSPSTSARDGVNSRLQTPTKRIVRVPTKSPKKSSIKLAQPQAKGSQNFSLYLLTFFVLSYLAWWREEKVAAGFCDTASTSNAPVRTRSMSLAVPAADHLSALSPSLGPVLDTLHIRPSCTLCPAHGRCASGAFLGCSADYVARQNPLRLGGMIPLPPRCVPDTEKLMIVALQASKAAKLLRVRRGEVICEGSERIRAREGRSDAWTYGLNAESLLAALQVENKMSGAPYEDNFLDEVNRLALRDLESHGEMITDQDGDEFWYAATEAEMPLSCRARLAAINHLKRHKLHITMILLAAFSVLWVRFKIRQYTAEKVQVRRLVSTVLDELRKQERQYHLDPALTPAASIAQSHLRDLILQHEHSPARRQWLWHKVEKVIEADSNVRAKQVEINGEDMRAWEWQGGPMLEREKGPSRAMYPSLQT